MIISSEVGLIIIERIKSFIKNTKKNVENTFEEFIKSNEDIFILNLKLEEELTNDYLNYVYDIINNNIEEDSITIFDIIKYGKSQIKKTVFTNIDSIENKNTETIIVNKYKPFILHYDIELKIENPIYLINDDNTIQYNGPKQRKISFQYIFEEVRCRNF